MDYFVALTGLPACGKETFKEALFEVARETGFVPFHISFTDVLRDECKARQMECNRENYTQVANQLRASRGSEALAERVVEKAESIRAEHAAGDCFFVLEAVRNPRESALFREKLGEGYTLVALTAPRETLIERIQSRKRVDEQPGAIKSRETIENMMDREWGIDQPPTGLQVGKCLEIADFTVDNSRDLEHLLHEARRLLRQILSE